MQNGAKPHDALPDDEVVIRRISQIQTDEQGRRFVSKSAFSASSKARDPEEGMSVDVLSVLQAQGIDPNDPAQYLPNVPVLMTMKVKFLHDNGLWVVRRSLPDNPAHCNVLGVKTNKRKLVFDHAEFLRRPPDVIKGPLTDPPT